MNHQPASPHTQLGRRITHSLLTAGAIALIVSSCGTDSPESASTDIEPAAPATAPLTSTAPETSTPQTSTTHPPITGAAALARSGRVAEGPTVGP